MGAGFSLGGGVLQRFLVNGLFVDWHVDRVSGGEEMGKVDNFDDWKFLTKT